MVLDIVEGQRRGRRRGPKMAKIHNLVKPDIFTYAGWVCSFVFVVVV